MTIGVAILTLNAGKDLPRLIPMVVGEALADRIMVIDSASTDGTVEWVLGQEHVELHQIARADFNHGATRELARKSLGTDIVVFLTQDVLPLPGWLKRLTAPIVDGRAVVSYARQLPHAGADIYEAFPREFNYPAQSQLRTIQDAKRYGVYAFFCSDSCSAYLGSALDEIGGFEATLTNEDYFAVARLLIKGGTIYYAAEAEVRHSHRYTLKEEFNRYFDTGYVRAENPWVTALVGNAENRGSAFLWAFLKQLASEAPLKLPYALLQTGVKWFGYRCGYLGYRMSRAWCRRLSSQRYYWNSVHCRHPR